MTPQEAAVQQLSIVRGRGGVARAGPKYGWITLDAQAHRFLRPIGEAFGTRMLDLWVERGVTAESFSRGGCEGLITALVPFHGRRVAVAWNDFRVNAASFSHANSRRFAASMDPASCSAEANPWPFSVTTPTA